MISVVGSAVGPSGNTVGVGDGVRVGGDVGIGVKVAVGVGVGEGLGVDVGVRVRVGVGVESGVSGSGLASIHSITMAARVAIASTRNIQGFSLRIVARIVPYGPQAGKQGLAGLWYVKHRPKVLLVFG